MARARTADETYSWLVGGGEPSFEQHVVASILALSWAEAEDIGRAPYEMAGYEGLPPVLAGLFPHVALALTGGRDLVREDEEICLLELLLTSTTSNSEFECFLAGLVARRAQRPNHLWQDLGLRNRGELSSLMKRYFGSLARRNRADMKWKKFFFRTICSAAEYSLCTAPSCSECTDFDNCFGEETGESFLAQLRRNVEQAV